MKKSYTHRPGVVMAMTLLCLMLLVGLLLYVMNVGWNAQARSTLQNAADSSAAAGAGWVARSFNTMALNNTSMTQLIAAVQVIDSVPLAVQLSRKELDQWSGRLHQQQLQGIDGWWIQYAVELFTMEVDRMVYDRNAGLEPLDNFFNHSGFDVRELTHYYGPGGTQGKFWVAIAAMDKLNLETMNQLGDQAVINATLAARANPATGDSTDGLLLPVVPEIPWKRGHFDDYERPVKYGLLPGSDQRLYNREPVPDGLGQVDDVVKQRGPWDTIFGWRRIIGGGVQGYWVPTNREAIDSARGNTPISRSSGGGGDGQFVVTGRTPPTHYDTYGVLEWTLDQATGSMEHEAGLLNRYTYRLRELAHSKLDYLWPGPLRQTGLRMRGYENTGKKAANDWNWEIPINKDYNRFWDGRNKLRTDPPAYEFFLEDGINTSSDDCTLRVRDMRTGFTEVTYIQPRGTQNWVYDVLDGDDNIVMEGLGRGVNGNNFGMSMLIPTPPKQVVDPVWITDFNSAVNHADVAATRQQIRETLFLAVEIESKYSMGHAKFLTPGTWRYVDGSSRERSTTTYPRLASVAGWMDPRGWGIPMTSPYVWLDQWQYQVKYDYTLGLDPKDTSDATEPFTGTVYCIDAFIFLGINVGPLIDVRNPNPLAQDINEKLAAPLDFDHAQMPPDKAGEGVRESRLTLLGLAWRGGEAAWWPGRFGLNDAPRTVATAQVTIFNDHSWDLWTQMWNTRLEPVRNLAGWTDRLSQANQGGRLPVTISSEALNKVIEQLRAAEKLEAVMATH